ncbi:MAG: LacI family DNA-binding transcriptional regulator [Paracoccaceae bacterium]
MDRRTATIQDVARAAGVSTATVSRTLSNPTVVAEATQTAVLNAVRETGYRVNHLASNLRRQRTGSIIALVPNLANPFFSQIMAGISSVLTPAQYGLLIADTQSGPNPDERLAHYLRSGVADGLILFDGALSVTRKNYPKRPPIIAACEWLGADIPSVRVDNEKGAELAVRHLAELGHGAIGHVTGPRGNVLAKARLNGFEVAMRCRGLEVRQDWVIEGDFSMDSGALAARRWLSSDDRPTALFFSSDEMAIGFMGAVQHAGFDVPQDVSVVGFDNIEVVEHLTPTLTTIRQPRTEIGMRAAELLLGMIDAGVSDCTSEVIAVKLIQRGSTHSPAKNS